MDTKSLLIGLSSFISGALLVSIAATTFDKPQAENNSDSMSAMVDSLEGKDGDDFDQAFIAEMITHHEGAIDMARLAKDNAKHKEIKQLSEAIISAQENEISEMQKWQKDWGYDAQEKGMQH